MSELSFVELIFDAPLDKYVDMPITYQLEDVSFEVTEYGNLLPICILYNNSTDPDPTTFIKLPNIDALFKKRLLIGDVVDHNLNLLERPADVSPALLPKNCPRCGSELLFYHQRKLIVKCVSCSVGNYQ